MGEVFRARDTRLDREVALKVLATTEAVHPDRLRRFEQEARATAALNHPNILAVFEVGTDGGVNYVSELLEGETLRDRLKTGAMPPRKTVDYAAQMARGLAAAHEKGIVHRDLKPEDLILTRDGRLKILDFGIAKLFGAAGGEQSIAPTIEPGTTPGMVLGTVGYMSPEQVRGLPADHRTDIFSFGAVVYEMLSGRRAFAGATQADTMSAILSADPPDTIDAEHPMPTILDRLARRCLEKNPEERFQSARDIAFNLEAIAATSGHITGGVAAVDVPTAPARLPRAWVAAALALGLMAGAAGAWIASARARPTPAPVKFQLLTFRRGTISAARFSLDGETIVYSSSWEGTAPELYSTRIGAIGERPADARGHSRHARVADGRLLIVTTAEGTRMLWPIDGGEPREVRGLLAEDVVVGWAAGGDSLFVSRPTPASGRDLARLDLASGRRQVVNLFGPSDRAGINGIGAPLVSADGRTYVYRYNQLLSDLFVGDGIR